MIKENIAQFYAVEIIVGRWKLLRAVGTGKPTSPQGYWPKKLSAYHVQNYIKKLKRWKKIDLSNHNMLTATFTVKKKPNSIQR